MGLLFSTLETFSPEGNVPKERGGLSSVNWENDLLWGWIAPLSLTKSF